MTSQTSFIKTYKTSQPSEVKGLKSNAVVKKNKINMSTQHVQTLFLRLTKNKYIELGGE